MTYLLDTSVLLEYSKRAENDRTYRIRQQIEQLDDTDETFKHAGYLSRDLKNQGLETPLIDCLIAATAIAHDSVLVTADRHFERFPDLKLLLLD